MKPANVVSAVLHRGVERLQALPQGRRDAQLLLLRVLNRDAAWLLTHPEAALNDEQQERYDAWIARRERHEPMQYILGEQEFYGLRFRVSRDVLIPRPETEHVVEAVLARVPRNATVRICDVGTGSGAIAVALAYTMPEAEVTGLDRSRGALVVARENAQRHGMAERVRFLESDLLEAVHGEQFDVVVSNPPYVGEHEVLEPQVAEYEPRAALFAGPTGLEVVRRLIPEAGEALVPGGWLVLEMGQGQRDAVAGLLAGWEEVSFVQDLQGISRVAIARRRASE
ncbi:MAG TPA: peptide chain release factor N(5)-glutamine methyltransferase [Acidobacteriaceae bacterium]|jgi:release factor glutamine methyltransferase|nr:peptide chain release factor N(5)-glutamine methyltransferase [Acidobacteriaceae bacterium]